MIGTLDDTRRQQLATALEINTRPISELAKPLTHAARVTPATGWSTVILMGTTSLVLVLGSRDSLWVQWLLPPLFAAIRAADDANAIAMLLITGHALLWASVVLTGYVVLRRTRPEQ